LWYLADQARPHCLHQFSKAVALGLRQVGSLTLRENGQQEYGNIVPAKICDDAVATTPALSAARHAQLPATARILHQIAGAWVLGNLDDRALAFLIGYARCRSSGEEDARLDHRASPSGRCTPVFLSDHLCTCNSCLYRSCIKFFHTGCISSHPKLMIRLAAAMAGVLSHIAFLSV
jgi:hypothetical protein